MEVTISPDAEDAYASGHIRLIEKGYEDYELGLLLASSIFLSCIQLHVRSISTIQ